MWQLRRINTHMCSTPADGKQRTLRHTGMRTILLTRHVYSGRLSGVCGGQEVKVRGFI